MTKYRIVEYINGNGSIFFPEVRVLLFFWSGFTEGPYYGEFGGFSVRRQTRDEAMEFIDKHRARQINEKKIHYVK